MGEFKIARPTVHHECSTMALVNNAIKQTQDAGSRMLKAGALVVTLIGFVATTGCHSLEITQPKRSVAEQLLLSTATDRAVTGIDLTPLRHKSVFVEERYFKSYDKGYAIGCLRQAISESGARLVKTRNQADLIVEIRSGALGLDTRSTLIGIPAFTVPIPLAGPVSTPEIAFYKSQLSDSTAKFALFAYERESGDHVHSSGPLNGTAYFNHYLFLGFFNWRGTDIPQLDLKLKEKVTTKQSR
jgi:hypothetical protein